MTSHRMTSPGKAIARERKRAASQAEKEAAAREFVNSRPEKERFLMRNFGSTLLRTADQAHGKITADGIGNFMQEYVHGKIRKAGRKTG